MECYKPKLIGTTYLPCGQCIACRITNAAMWSLRITHELQYWSKSSFLTATYSDEFLPQSRGLTKGNSLFKKDLTNFWKRARKNFPLSKFRYFAVGEYGDQSERPHYHAIIFGLDSRNKESFYSCWKMCNPERFTMGKVNIARINYVTSYCIKKLTGQLGKEAYEQTGREPPFLVNSNGIGFRFCDKYSHQIKELWYIRNFGKEVPVPMYYRKKLGMTSEEKFKHQKKSGIYGKKWTTVGDFEKQYWQEEANLNREQWERELKQIEKNMLTKFNINSRRGGQYI